MKVWIRRVLICLGLGVVVTVLSAWAITLNATDREAGQRGQRMTAVSAGGIPLRASSWYKAPTGAELAFEDRHGGTGFEYCADWIVVPEPAAMLEAHRLVVGLPLRAMVMERMNEHTQTGMALGEWSGVPLPAWMRGRVFDAVPCEVLPGFYVNVLFFAAVAGVLWSAPVIARRSHRRRRGACARCGYDLRGLGGGGCPECGVGVRA